MISICVSFCSLQNKLPLPQWLKKHSIISFQSSCRSEIHHDVLVLCSWQCRRYKNIGQYEFPPTDSGKFFLQVVLVARIQFLVLEGLRSLFTCRLAASGYSASRGHKHSLTCATSIFNSTIKIIFFLCFKSLIFLSFNKLKKILYF